MRFQWDWLSPVVQAPYVPTLGAVNPRALSAELFETVVSVADTGRFLPYDKDHRWSDRKDERVIPQEIIHTPTMTVIPTLALRGRATLKVHCYSQEPPDLTQISQWSGKWCTTHGATTARVLWPQNRPDGARTRLMLKTYTQHDQYADDARISELVRQPPIGS